MTKPTAPSRPEKTGKPTPSSGESASKKADKIARKGEPLDIKDPKDRSPKQENL